MKLQTGRAIISLLLVAAILIISLNAWFAFRSVNVLLEGEGWVQHTWQVITEIEVVLSTTKDAGSGNIHFLLDGDEAELKPYLNAVQAIPRDIDKLRALTADNPRQQQAIAQLSVASERRIALLQASVDARRSSPMSIERALALNATGKEPMDQLRDLADRMESEERRLLAIRIEQTRLSSVRTKATVGIASFIDFLLIVMMFRYFTRERTMRLASEETASRLAVARLELETSAAQVHALNRTLEERVQLRTAELEATNKELEAFSYSVSHDLRSPLRTIDGFSLALEEDYAEIVGATGKDYIHRVRTGVQRMGELIDALLQLSRITRAPIVRERFDMSALAEWIAEDLQEQDVERVISFKVESGLVADADPKLIRVALENLLGNAVKFSGKVPHAVIEFGWDAAQKGWYVRDNGAGFDMHYANKLFNAFNRLHGDKDFKGSGIGLATVARVVRRHHGTIWADSVINHGATFWFTLG